MLQGRSAVHESVPLLQPELFSRLEQRRGLYLRAVDAKKMPGPVETLLTTDHVRIDALLARAKETELPRALRTGSRTPSMPVRRKPSRTTDSREG